MPMKAAALYRCLRRLRRDTRAVSIVEFAFALPLFLIITISGLEVANLAITSMRVNQIAISLADNASRLKQQSVGSAPRIRDYDVNQAFTAAALQGANLGIVQNGRLFLSSLETNTAGGQWIHWQRCQGNMTSYQSSYGKQGDGKTGTGFPGMGPVGKEVTAEPDSAIMVAEIAYKYQPLIAGNLFGDIIIRKYSAMYVRDDRDLSGDGISNLSPQVTVSACS